MGEKGDKPKKKICCACPETKVSAEEHHRATRIFLVAMKFGTESLIASFASARAKRSHHHWLTRCFVLCRSQGPRDTCIAEKGPEHEDCLKLIEAHKKCLRAEGFKID